MYGEFFNVVYAYNEILFFLVQSLSCIWLFVPPWTAACQAFLSFTISQSLPKFMSFESVMLSNHLILCHPLLLLPSIFPSLRVFYDESALHIRWPIYWSFSFSIRSSNEYSGLISFRIDWLGLFAVQGTLKSLLQHHNWKASVSFPESQLFISGDQSIGTSASVLPMNIQSWFPLRLTGLFCLLSKRFLSVFSNTTIRKRQFFSAQPSLWSNTYICMQLLERP